MEISTVDDLIDELSRPSEPQVRAGLVRAWTNGSLADWLETRNCHYGQPDQGLMDRIQDLVKRLGDNPKLALFALLQTLQPSRPLALLPEIDLDAPSDIPTLFATHPERRRQLLAALSEQVSSGKFAEWLRASDFPGWQDSIQCLRTLPDPAIRGVEDLPGYAVRWQYDRRAPFPTGDTEAGDPAALAAWINTRQKNRDLGAELLESGWLDLWLELTGHVSQPSCLQPLRDLGCSDAAKMELLLRRLDPARPVPQLKVGPKRLHLGKLSPGAVAQQRFTISTRGAGHIWGVASLHGNTEGMRLEPLDFDGAPVRFTLALDTIGIPPFTKRTAEVEVRCNDGQGERVLRLPVSYQVRVSLFGAIGRSILAGAAVGGIMTLLRLWAGSTINGLGAADRRLDWVSVKWVANVFDRSFGDFVLLVLMAIALISVLTGGIAYLVRLCRG